jgi:16S rRNA (adenine1518-N6/adenine1519-N6)-dimethyltransferase
MAQTKHDIQQILTVANTQPRHRFGQNFMIDANFVRLIAQTARLSADELVIEIGPGTGTLTEELLASAGRVLAVEIDRDLAGLLQERFVKTPGFQLIVGDALANKHSLHPLLLEAIRVARDGGQPVKLVANLPYNIASPLVIELLRAGVEELVFTVQKEVAQRLQASAGDDAYGPLSVMANMLSRVEILRTIPPQVFWPAPKIESALVRMVAEDRLGEHSEPFGQFVHHLFSARRKMVRKTLSTLVANADAILVELKLDGNVRPENLSPETFWLMYQAMGHQTK